MPVIRLPDDILDEVIDHVRDAHPEEGCGLLAVDASGRVRRAYRLANVDRSGTSFTVDPDGHFAAIVDAEANGWSIGGVFHSHPHGPAIPSPVDLAAPIDPEWLHVVIGLADRDHPEVRAWRVRGGEMSEVDVI